MPIKALFFDLDDTLLETHEAHQAALRTACDRAAEAHPSWTAERLVEAFTQAYRSLEAQLETGEVQFSSQEVFRTVTWQETLRACDLAPDLAEELARVYLSERRRQFRTYRDVEPALEMLSQRYRLVLVTNGLGDLQREKVRAVRLERWFSHVAISGEIGSWKPDSGIFKHALGLADIAPEEGVMLGDSLERDVAGAAALGMRTVWIRRYAHLQPMDGIRPDAVLPNLTELERLLAEW